jgi:hypothetical protein
MIDTPSDVKISLLRWLAWVSLCLGMAFEIFIVRSVGLSVLNRLIAGQAIWQQDAGQSVDISLLERFFNFGQLIMIVIICIIAVSLTVMLDYYLRAGEKNGRLFRRIGLVAGIELGVYALAMLIQSLI